jgi:hypothetical protein
MVGDLHDRKDPHLHPIPSRRFVSLPSPLFSPNSLASPAEPNNDSPLNPNAAQLWSNVEETRKMVKKQWLDNGGGK